MTTLNVKTGYYVHFISALCSNPMEKKEWETLSIRVTKGNDVRKRLFIKDYLR